MKQPQQRRAIVISAILTAFILTLVGGALLVRAARSQTASGAAEITVDDMAAEPPIVVTVQPVLVPTEQQAMPPAFQAEATAGAAVDQAGLDPTSAEIIAAYQARLEEAYAALTEAYTQIDALQAASDQAVSLREDDRDREGHEYREHDDDDDEHRDWRAHDDEDGHDDD